MSPNVDLYVKHISPSSIATWDECRRKWGKMYAEGRHGVSIARGNVLGSFVHAVLERLFSLPPSQRIFQNARAIAANEFDKITGPDAKPDWGIINPDEDEQFTKEFKQDAWDSILNELDMEDAEKVDVSAVEIELGGTINGVPFKGFVDRLDLAPDKTFIVNDYKNGKVPTYPDAKRKAARQLVLYAANLAEEGFEIKLARFLYTAYAKIVPVKINRKLIRAAGVNLAETWEAMHAETDWEPTTSALCAFCPFVLECPEGKAVAMDRLRQGKSVGDSTRMLLESGS